MSTSKETAKANPKTAIKPKVLLVEDEPLVQKIQYLMLKEIGCNVYLTKTGLQTLNLCYKNHYDIIFMDIGLPDINGIEVTKKLRANKNNNCKIIALTAFIDKKIHSECLAAGMNMVEIKPINVYKLKQICFS